MVALGASWCVIGMWVMCEGRGLLVLLATKFVLGGRALLPRGRQAEDSSRRISIGWVLGGVSPLAWLFTSCCLLCCAYVCNQQVEPQLVPCCICSPWPCHTCAQCLRRRHLRQHPGESGTQIQTYIYVNI